MVSEKISFVICHGRGWGSRRQGYKVQVCEQNTLNAGFHWEQDLAQQRACSMVSSFVSSARELGLGQRARREGSVLVWSL